MLRKRLLTIVLALALIVMGAMRPAPARANSVAENFGIAMVALGGWLLLIIGGAWAVYGPPWSSLNPDVKPDMNGLEPHRAIQFGARCQPAPGSPQPVACW
jgi:hypothetical protein